MFAAILEVWLTLYAIGAFVYLLRGIYLAVSWLYEQLPYRRAHYRKQRAHWSKHTLAARWIRENLDAARLLPGYSDTPSIRTEYFFIEQNFNNDGEPK